MPQGASSLPRSVSSPWPWRVLIVVGVALCLLMWRRHQPRPQPAWNASALLQLTERQGPADDGETRPKTGEGEITRNSAAPGAAATKQHDPAEAAGFGRVNRLWGPGAPVGRGVVVGHVEAMPGEYLPRFGDEHFRGVAFDVASGPARFSGHADATCRLLYGRHGLAPGVSQVRLFESLDWMGPGCLRVASHEPPSPAGCRVFTHGWVLDLESDITLARLDWLIDQAGVIVVTGVDNGGNTGVPAIPVSAYNNIAVGLPGRRSSTGHTRGAAAGRCKPELVVDMPRTSFAGPVVAAAAARLLEEADRMVLQFAAIRSMLQHPGAADPSVTALAAQFAAAGRPQVVKALLLSGADKSCGFQPEPGKPLDAHHGAGLLRVDRSLEMLRSPVAPSATPMETAQPVGWDYRLMKPQGEAAYEFELTRPMKSWTITLVWHRRVDAVVATSADSGQTHWLMEGTRLADFNLRLIAGKGADVRIVARSTSGTDNVEHLFLTDVPAGRYRIDVRRQDGEPEDWAYAVAWRGE